MGTINYRTSDYITLGYNCNEIDYDEPFYYEFIQDSFDQVKETRARYLFEYFSVTVEPGYYEGFYINIEFNYSYCLDCWTDRRAAQKEITRVKNFLLECVNFYDLVSVYPGWCTGYADYNQTIKDINAAVYEMRQTVKNAPTWLQLARAGEV